MASGSGWNLRVWLAGGGCGWNLWVWLVDVVVRRYIDFLILLIPTPLVPVPFCSSIPTFCSFFYVFRSCRITIYNLQELKELSHVLCVHTGSSVLYFNVCPTSVFQITHI